MGGMVLEFGGGVEGERGMIHTKQAARTIQDGGAGYFWWHKISNENSREQEL